LEPEKRLELAALRRLRSGEIELASELAITNLKTTDQDVNRDVFVKHISSLKSAFP
jgi:hypothetical protein